MAAHYSQQGREETLIWIWGDLLRLRLITPTGKDLVVPDDWVRVTDKGIAAIEGKSYVEYDEHEVFIAKGEVYTACRTISNIMSQAQKEILVIDPYVDEDLLDMFASLDPSVKIRVLKEHLKGNFKQALRKLQPQRGGIDVRCSTQFHDRFIVVDGNNLPSARGIDQPRRREGHGDRDKIGCNTRPCHRGS